MDKIDITPAIAEAKNHSTSLPRGRTQQIIIMRKIAKTLQKGFGSFFYDQIYDILEQAYGEDVAEHEEEVIKNLDAWLENDKTVEYLGEEGTFHTYRIK